MSADRFTPTSMSVLRILITVALTRLGATWVGLRTMAECAYYTHKHKCRVTELPPEILGKIFGFEPPDLGSFEAPVAIKSICDFFWVDYSETVIGIAMLKRYHDNPGLVEHVQAVEEIFQAATRAEIRRLAYEKLIKYDNINKVHNPLLHTEEDLQHFGRWLAGEEPTLFSD